MAYPIAEFYLWKQRVRATWDEQPLFVLKDILKAMKVPEGHIKDDYSRGQIISRFLRGEDGGGREYTLISYAGVYELALRLGNPDSTRVLSWVQNEVLPYFRDRCPGEAPLDESTHGRVDRAMPPGERFRKDRIRAGFLTRRDLSDAARVPMNMLHLIEDLHDSAKKYEVLRALALVGIDIRYWKSGVPLNVPYWDDEKTLLSVWRALPEERRRALYRALRNRERRLESSDHELPNDG